MSTETLPDKPAPAPEGGTEAGNYFVSNYPPFSFWQAEQIPAIARVLDSPPNPDVPLGVYFHIPFCRKRCHFCYFRVYTDRKPDEIRRYVRAGMKEFEMYAKRNYLKGRKPQFVYFGGGTPSYLSVPQLEELTGHLKELMPWDEIQEVTFEAEPGTLTEKKLDAIRNMGVTRLSLGVENFDDHILDINGRAHRSMEVYRAYGYARNIGFPQINIDLIAGMLEETEDNWKRCVEKALEMQPDCLTIYQMEVPYNTGIYKTMQEEGKLVAPIAGWATKRRWVDYAFSQFEAAGYEVGSAYTVVKNKATTKFVYRDGLFGGADLLPLGVASFGHLGGVHIQNNADIGAYCDAIERGEHAVFRAYATDPDERLIRDFILHLKLGSVKPPHYQKKFGVNVLERFAPQLAWLSSEGFATVTPEIITMHREGLLQVDRLLHEFFLPHHRHARYT
ncbi:MAG: coproporphyrinogen oxidase family protein [Verrucomicrobiales bacterium]|nr:coproporphyrinogen oxidase family protein [Verrucomicrobiales bacterium]